MTHQWRWKCRVWEGWEMETSSSSN